MQDVLRPLQKAAGQQIEGSLCIGAVGVDQIARQLPVRVVLIGAGDLKVLIVIDGIDCICLQI
ncbi:Uncharacterised protein [uncultured Blautia sp.]|nr:Uncharacterised protein [uncultured Blautia sp.]